MTTSTYWADSYIEKKCDAAAAVRRIRPGQRVFIGSACGEPQELVRSLSNAANRLTGLEIIRMMSQETTSLTAIANQTRDYNMYIRTIYLGSVGIESIDDIIYDLEQALEQV